jgi:hypothetical protein
MMSLYRGIRWHRKNGEGTAADAVPSYAMFWIGLKR